MGYYIGTGSWEHLPHNCSRKINKSATLPDMSENVIL